ncbi:unnamed protein product [Caenorhabditis bovis]|uniref:Uncharacterized protein n=1 Tax=Caenorhabditis bovis TaxID=2654633 RepID=A0A8S1F083_9PELO|nr:unnamed protein product [Caenorhabditis bovis]
MRQALILSAIFAICFSDSSIRVRGAFKCDGKPYPYAELQIINDRSFGYDVIKKQIASDHGGHFDIAGYVDSSKLTPFLHIWHRCWKNPDKPQYPCYRYFKIQIPEIFVSHTRIPTTTWDMGVIELHPDQDFETMDGC